MPWKCDQGHLFNDKDKISLDNMTNKDKKFHI